MEKFVDSASAVRFAACCSFAEDALAVLVQLHARGRGQNDLSGEFLRRNAGVRNAHRASYVIRAAGVCFWGGAGIAVLRATRFGDALHFSLSALRALSKRARKTNGGDRRDSTRFASSGGLCAERSLFQFG